MRRPEQRADQRDEIAGLECGVPALKADKIQPEHRNGSAHPRLGAHAAVHEDAAERHENHVESGDEAGLRRTLRCLHAQLLQGRRREENHAADSAECTPQLCRIAPLALENQDDRHERQRADGITDGIEPKRTERIAPLQLKRERKAPDDCREKQNEDIFELTFLHTDMPLTAAAAVPFEKYTPILYALRAFVNSRAAKSGKVEKARSEGRAFLCKFRCVRLTLQTSPREQPWGQGE